VADDMLEDIPDAGASTKSYFPPINLMLQVPTKAERMGRLQKVNNDRSMNAKPSYVEKAKKTHMQQILLQMQLAKQEIQTLRNNQMDDATLVDAYKKLDRN